MFSPHPLGDPINGSPHSVCVSLPTMADVIGYEEKDPGVLSSFKAGYPRFFQNPLVTRLARRVVDEHCMETGDPLLPDEATATDLCAFLGINETNTAPVDDIWTVRLHGLSSLREKAAEYLRHTGGGLSSREAEQRLADWFGGETHPEERADGSAGESRARITSHLHEVYGTAAESDIRLFRSGMNAFYAGFRALQAVQLKRNRDLWIQLGWLYVDTARVLEKFGMPETKPMVIHSVTDLDSLRQVLSEHGHRVAGIVTEVPTNPLVQTPDLQVLRELADRHRAGLILDPTLVSPHNLNILEFADIHINSLTKYAAAEADVMMGALALNAKSRFYDDLLPLVDVFGSAPSEPDLARMACQIAGYPETIRKMNRSTEAVAAFLESHPGVREVHWAKSGPAGYNYSWLQHREAGPGSIISFTTRGSLAAFYDASNLVKSPSFGARFTMMCPFMYLAHYDLVKRESGRTFLRENGLDTDLVRLSVGLEPPEAIIAELDRTL